jgi:hypothetical protein
MWLIETKGARDREQASIWDKAKAALEWCRTASQVVPPGLHPDGSTWTQAQIWRYGILFDDQWDRKPALFEQLAQLAEAQTLAYLRGQGWVEEGSLLSLMRE